MLAVGLAAGGTSVRGAESDAVDPARALHLLKVNCQSCHNAEKRKGGLDLSTREALLKGGDEGAVVVEGRPEESTLITSLAADADPHMPPKKQLTDEHIAVLAGWLRAGAPWGDAGGRAGEPAPRPVALGPLPDGYRPVMALALSPDGRQLAAGSGPEVVIFDIAGETPVLRARSRAHLDPVQSVAWTPDGRRLVSGAFRRVMVWNAQTLAPEREILSGLTDRITAIQVLPDGAQALLADGLTAEKGVVRVLDLAGGAVVRSWSAHGDTIFAMALSADGQNLATAGGDALVRLWEVATGQETARLEGHATQVLCLSFNPEATQLVTGGADRQLKVWDVKTRENIVALAAKSTAFNAVTWNATGPVFAVTEDGSLLRYTDMKPHTGAQSSDTGNERQLGSAGAALFCVAATPDGGRVFAGTSDGRLLSWDKEGKASDPIDISSATVAAAPAEAPAQQ
jgi:WD40 repeat protein/mono/diheme cytochrome c family protein